MKVVYDSFEEERNKLIITPSTRGTMTRAEISRRTEIVYKWFVTMRADCGYTIEKALDLLPAALRAEMNGDDWVPPPADASWSPADARSN